MESFDKTRITIQGRSDGDGMEYTPYGESTQSNEQTANKYTSSEPKYSKNFAPFPGKRKEPKFVPYEPYKAAVSPIIPSTRKYESVSTHVVIDSQKVSSLASSVIQFNFAKELHSIGNNVTENVAVNNYGKKECDEDCAQKVKEFEKKIMQLEMEKKELQSQFQIQTQVNADLKKMLLASLGEDMQLKVQYMTEDKARLGMNVLQFSEELGIKNEEIEKLSVQSDVWKSKFEASSVMVDELARWKVSLSQKLNQAVFALDSLLKEHKTLSDQLGTTYNILKSTQTAFNPSSHIVTKRDHSLHNLMQLSKEIHNLSISIQERLLGRASARTNSYFANKGATELTPAEHAALQVLKAFDNLSIQVNYDLNTKAHREPGKTACQILPHVCTKETTVNCCKQCSGEIQLL